jgi:hypothetical protein
MSIDSKKMKERVANLGNGTRTLEREIPYKRGVGLRNCGTEDVESAELGLS